MSTSFQPPRDSFGKFSLWLAALFLVIVGARLLTIQFYGSALPFLDQWDEARTLFIPWLEGHLTWNTLFAAHSEHRILFTRLLDLLELRLNGQWDPRLQMVVNAFLYTGFACGLAGCLWVFAGKKWGGWICFLLAPFFAPPFAAENTLHGFQSGEYFLNIFSVATIVGLGFGTPGKGWWWLGLAAAVMSLFTMASGLLAAMTVAGLAVGRMSRQKAVSRNHLITLGCGLGVFSAGLFLNVTVEQSKPFQANDLHVFLNALMHNLAWPFLGHPLLFVITCLPLVILGIQYFRSQDESPRRSEFILTLALWGFLQSVALAYGRGAVLAIGNLPSRYMDSLVIIPIASLVSLFVIADFSYWRPKTRQLFNFCVFLAMGAYFYGLWQIGQMKLPASPLAKPYLQWNQTLNAIEEVNVRTFIATDDPSVLLNQPLLYIPYPDGEKLATDLRDPELSTILPPICRRPLQLIAAANSDGAFVPDGFSPEAPKREFAQVWGSYSTNGADATGNFVSKPIFPKLPELSIQLCCGSSTNGIHIQLVEEQTGRVTEIAPNDFGRWHTVMVRVPKNPFRLHITDQSRDAWVAVGEIHEVGGLSVGAMKLLDHGSIILLAGLCLYMVASGWNIIHCGKIFCGQNLPEYLVLLTAMAALVFLWPTRNLDVTAFDGVAHKEVAAYFASNGDWANAERHFREALWRQPDPATFSQLADVISRRSHLKTNLFPNDSDINPYKSRKSAQPEESQSAQ